jgi:rod shape-determining protein MreB
VALLVALDVGTATTRLATSDGAISLSESSVVAIDTRNGDIVDVGDGAWRMVARSPQHVVNYRPLANGTTVDFDVAARLIRAMFDRAGFGRIHVTMSVPSLATSIERRALRQAALQAGASEVALVESTIAAAIGAQLAVEEPVASPIMVLGAGATETAVMSLGGIVTHRSVRVGGAHLDEAIADILRTRYGVVIAPHVAASLKIGIASPLGSLRKEVRVVPARTVETGQPVSVEVSGGLVEAAISDHIRTVVRSVKECLSEAPPDLAQDVSVRGITLAGGVAQMTDVAELLTREVGVVCHTPPQPDLLVLRGLLRCVNEVSALRRTSRNFDD